jgi:hypothetical protein
MNKNQRKQVDIAKQYLAMGMADAAARSVSALVRCAMTKKSKTDLMQFAKDHNLINHVEFIV